jgi:hypothetical protein
MIALARLAHLRQGATLLAALAAAGLAALPAHAGQCRCYVSQQLIPDFQAAGRIDSVRNSVQATTRQGWQPAQAGQSLGIGDSVRTGADGGAEIRFGTRCKISLGPGSVMIVRPVDQNFCVGVDRSLPPADADKALF